MVNSFIKTNDDGQALVLPDRLMINQCFYYFRTLYQNLSKKKGGASGVPLAITGGPDLSASPGRSASGAAEVEVDADAGNAAAKTTEISRLNMLVK